MIEHDRGICKRILDTDTFLSLTFIDNNKVSFIKSRSTRTKEAELSKIT